MTFTKQGNFTKKVSDLPNTPSPDYTPAQIKEYFDTPANELKETLNKVVDELNADRWVGTKKIAVQGVERENIKKGAVGVEQLDSSITSQPKTEFEVQAKFANIDAFQSTLKKVKLIPTPLTKWVTIFKELGVSPIVGRYNRFNSDYSKNWVETDTFKVIPENNVLRILDNSTGNEPIQISSFNLPITNKYKMSFNLSWNTKGALVVFFTKATKVTGIDKPEPQTNAIRIDFNTSASGGNDTFLLKNIESGTTKNTASKSVVLGANDTVVFEVTPTTITATVNGITAQITNSSTNSNLLNRIGFHTSGTGTVDVKISNLKVETEYVLQDTPKYQMKGSEFMQFQADYMLSVQNADGSFPLDNAKDVYGPIPYPTIIASHCAGVLYSVYQITGIEKYRTAALKACDYLVSMQNADGAWHEYGNLINALGRQLGTLVDINVVENNPTYTASINKGIASVIFNGSTHRWDSNNPYITLHLNAYNQQAHVNSIFWKWAVFSNNVTLKTNCEDMLINYLAPQTLPSGLWTYDETQSILTYPATQDEYDRVLNYGSLIVWSINEMKKYSPNDAIWGNTTVSTMINKAVNALRCSLPLDLYGNSSDLWAGLQGTDGVVRLLNILIHHGYYEEANQLTDAISDTWFTNRALNGSAIDGAWSLPHNLYQDAMTSQYGLIGVSQQIDFKFADVSYSQVLK